MLVVAHACFLMNSWTAGLACRVLQWPSRMGGSESEERACCHSATWQTWFAGTSINKPASMNHCAELVHNARLILCILSALPTIRSSVQEGAIGARSRHLVPYKVESFKSAGPRNIGAIDMKRGTSWPREQHNSIYWDPLMNNCVQPPCMAMRPQAKQVEMLGHTRRPDEGQRMKQHVCAEP
jgi:hypothetical protein